MGQVVFGQEALEGPTDCDIWQVSLSWGMRSEAGYVRMRLSSSEKQKCEDEQTTECDCHYPGGLHPYYYY